MKNFFKNLIALIVLAVFVFVFRDKIESTYNQIFYTYLPCQKPIVYSVGSFDKDFGVSKEEFVSAINEAELIWEKPSGKDLFVFTNDESPSNLVINLTYDSRQESTDKLKQIDAKLGNKRTSYDALKDDYEKLKMEYSQKKTDFNSKVTAFEVRSNKYEKDVAYANAHGGANESEYARLQQEQISLNNEARTINKLQAEINKMISMVNDTVRELNSIATSLNLDVKKFNEIGASNGEEFEEGIYIRDIDGTRINIYQFDNKAKLVRVLAHELGHALGLDHIEDSKAIMYRLNSGTNKDLTPDDLVELNKKCSSNFLKDFKKLI